MASKPVSPITANAASTDILLVFGLALVSGVELMAIEGEGAAASDGVTPGDEIDRLALIKEKRPMARYLSQNVNHVSTSCQKRQKT